MSPTLADMTRLTRVPAAPASPGGQRRARRRLPSWCAKPFAALRQAWCAQAELWERWYAAPYRDDGPLRWRRQGGKEVLDGSVLPQDRKERL